MKRSSRAWVLFPAVILVAVVAVVVASNYQKEVGLAEPSKGGRAAVAAMAAAYDLSTGTGAADYQVFSEALLVAAAARNNAPAMNPSDTRLDHLLLDAYDCLAAVREAWQAEIDQSWDPEIQGASGYWNSLHPTAQIAGDRTLTAGDVRRICGEQAGGLLEQALDLAG
jgi:hypothetical protein